jgi:hypothetical protein
MAGYTDEARAILTPLAARDDGDPTAALAHVAVREGRLGEAAALLQRHLAAHPARRHVHYTLTRVLPHLGRFEEANRHAARGTLITCVDLQVTSSRVVRFPNPHETTTPEIPFDRQVRHEAPGAVKNSDAVYVVGCDSRYLVNPDLAAEALLKRLRVNPLLPIVCSRESLDLSEFTERQRRTYLACARYLILPELLERYSRPMLVAAADQLVVADLRPLLRDLEQHDVGLMRNNGCV